VNYGVCVHHGTNVRQDWICVASFVQLSVDQGNHQGQFNYGTCLEKDLGVAQDLVCVYPANGLVVAKDLVRAAEESKSSAHQGHDSG
jgi:hypothetical protein